MQIKTLQHDEFIKSILVIKMLLKSSYKNNFNISEKLCNNIVETKIQELDEYIKSKKAILFGAFIKASLVGFIWLYVHDYYGEIRLHVNQIVIDKNFRGQGIAKGFLRETEKLATALKIETIDLFVSEENLAAVKMYENLGYVTERRYLKKKI